MRRNRWVGITAVGLSLVLVPLIALAQERATDVVGLKQIMEKEMTRRADLVRLDSSRETFVGEIVNRWTATARERGYNLETWKQDMTGALSPLTREKLLA